MMMPSYSVSIRCAKGPVGLQHGAAVVEDEVEVDVLISGEVGFVGLGGDAADEVGGAEAGPACGVVLRSRLGPCA